MASVSTKSPLEKSYDSVVKAFEDELQQLDMSSQQVRKVVSLNNSSLDVLKKHRTELVAAMSKTNILCNEVLSMTCEIYSTPDRISSQSAMFEYYRRRADGATRDAAVIAKQLFEAINRQSNPK